MLNDLAVFTEPGARSGPYGDTEGDAHKHWPADPKAYYLYFTDDGTYGKETRGRRRGLLAAGGARGGGDPAGARAGARMTVRVTGGPAGDA